MQHYQFPIIGVFALLGCILGFRQTRSPKAFNLFTAICKFMKLGAMSYNGLCGIAFHALRDFHGRQDWDASINKMLTAVFLLFAFGLGFYSAVTTLVPFEANHESGYISKKMKDAARYLKDAISCNETDTQCIGTTGALFGCPNALFSKHYEKENDNVLSELTMLARA